MNDEQAGAKDRATPSSGENAPSMEDPASAGMTRTTPASFHETDRMGPYRILERLGEGGMGEVHKAEQMHPIRRLVALKVIKRGMDTTEVVARFEAERQALALMDHPGIAKVFEAGATPRGRPFFAMEYVHGEPITTYCDKNQLSTRRRLELFIQLCEGVQHAHQKAIIHRDLKPSNVLVTIQEDSPVPKIIDFGVAKATAQKLTEKTMYTALGELIGTPEYMSPEQAEMSGTDVDTRTDVYALGVILYELLVGALPFDPQELRKAGFAGIVRILRESDPARPSTKVSTLGKMSTDVAKARRTIPERLRGTLRGDLDWITMKALERDRTRRYGSAADLAADVRRHLRHEPVTASPPSATYRMRKFIRRHRFGVGAGIAVVGVILAFAVMMSFQAKRIAMERDRANAEARAAREVTEFLVGSFEVADPREPRDDEVTAREILERGAERVERELQEQPLLRARMMDSMGRVYQNLNRYDRAEEMLRGALALRRDELGDWHADVAKSMGTLGYLLSYREKVEEGRALAEQALAIQQDLLEPDDVDLAWTLYYLGTLEMRGKAYVQAREHLERAREIFEGPSAQNMLAASWCYQNLGKCYYESGDYAKAWECSERAYEIKRQVLPEDHFDIAISLHWKGMVQYHLEDYAAAIGSFRLALEKYEKTVGMDHDHPAYTMHMLGNTYRESEDPAEAKAWYDRAIAIFRRASDGESYNVANVLDDMGLLEHRAGRYAQADSVFAVALPMMERAFPLGKGNMNAVGLLEHYAATLRVLGQDAGAARLEERARAIRTTLEKESAAE